MKNLFAIATLFMSLLCFAGNVCFAQSATVEGNIQNLGNDSVFIQVNALSRKDLLTDTIIAKNDRFVYSRKVNKATVVFIQFKKTEAWNTPANKYYVPQSKTISIILLPNDRSFINGKITSSAVEYSIKGMPVNQELAAMRMNNLSNQIDRYFIFTKIDSLFKVGKSSEVRPYTERYSDLVMKATEVYETYISDHPNSALSVYYLACFNSPDIFGIYINKISAATRNGILKDVLVEKADLYQAYLQSKSIKMGSPAATFTLMDNNGKSFSLQDKKGKYVLLDFWGSWCKPCIEGMSTMKTYYHKYHTKLVIVGIDCDDTPSAWKNAVQQYGLPWMQLIDDKDPVKSASIKFGINLFPTKILIDPSGNIVSITSGETSTFYADLDKLFGQ